MDKFQPRITISVEAHNELVADHKRLNEILMKDYLCTITRDGWGYSTTSVYVGGEIQEELKKTVAMIRQKELERYDSLLKKNMEEMQEKWKALSFWKRLTGSFE